MHLTVLTLAALLVAGLATPGMTQTADEFIDHGVAVDVSTSRGAAAAVDGDGKRIVMVWLSDHRGCTNMLVIDAETGETEQIEYERGHLDHAYAVLFSTKGKWYSQFASRFYEFDPATRSFTFIGQTRTRCAMSMTEDQDGMIWVAGFPNADLLSFNPETQELVDHGQLQPEEETWRQYQRSIAYDDAGWIYTGMGNVSAQVAGYNTATGEIRRYIPEQQRGQGSGRVFRGTDGQVYATGPGYGWQVLHNGEATALETDEPPVGAAPEKTGSQGTLVRDFPDGSRVTDLNVPDRTMTVQDADGTERQVTYDYQSEGGHILSIHLGPDNDIYGVTGGFAYRYHPPTGEFLYHRRPGHLNDMATQRGMVFGAKYTGGELYGYDISVPWDQWDASNPAPLGRGNARPHINRPAVLIAHPDGRHLIMGGTPGYGRTGGGLYIYDLETETDELLTHEEMLENLSTCSLVALPDGNLVGGTTVAAGTGGRVLAEQAELYMFDFANRQVAWREAIVPGATSYRDMVLGPDGLVYGIAGGATLFVFDPESRAVVHQDDLSEYGSAAGAQAPRCMIMGPDENIYMLFGGGIVRIEPRSFEHTKLADTPAGVSAGVALLDGRLYFASGSRLWSYAVPDL